MKYRMDNSDLFIGPRLFAGAQYGAAPRFGLTANTRGDDALT